MGEGANYNERPFHNYERKSFPIAIQLNVTQERWDEIFGRCDDCGESKGECTCRQSNGSSKTDC